MSNTNPLTTILQSKEMEEISAAAYKYLMDLDRVPADPALVIQHIRTANQVIDKIDQLLRIEQSLVMQLQGLMTWFLFFTYCYHVLDQQVDRDQHILPLETLRYRNLAADYRGAIGRRLDACILKLQRLDGFNSSQISGISLLVNTALNFMPAGDTSLHDRVNPLLVFLKTIPTG